MDPDPVGSEKNHYETGQLRLRNEFGAKLLLKTDRSLQFLNENAQFENINSCRIRAQIRNDFFRIKMARSETN